MNNLYYYVIDISLTIIMRFIIWIEKIYNSCNVSDLFLGKKKPQKTYDISYKGVCPICKINKKTDILIRSCGHYGFCEECYCKLNVCPFCRKK